MGFVVARFMVVDCGLWWIGGLWWLGLWWWIMAGGGFVVVVVGFMVVDYGFSGSVVNGGWVCGG